MRVLITGGTGLLGKALAETCPRGSSILSVHLRAPRVMNPGTNELLADGRERFTGCVVFPVGDTEGRLVTLYGRQTAELKQFWGCEPGIGIFGRLSGHREAALHQGRQRLV